MWSSWLRQGSRALPRETIGIPVGQDPLYEASAAFLAVLAHPSSETHRTQFHRALCRSTILQMAEEDAVFAWSRQFIKPGCFLMDDATCSAALKHGGAELSERKAAAVSTWVLFDEALSGASIKTIRAFGAAYSNTPGHRHFLLNVWRNVENTEATIKKVTTRIEGPARPVIHAAYAIWRTVRDLRNAGVRDDSTSLQIIMTHRDKLNAVLELAEHCRQIAPKIKDLKVQENDLIQFVVT
jgi:hypothetical protein